MVDALSDGQLAALAGAGGGILLGLAARMGRFCTLGAIEDRIYGGSDIRLRMWGLAISLSLLGTGLLAWAGLFDPAASIYHGIGWNPLASIVGGLAFGYGMALTGHCAHGALARLGGGDLRGFVVVLVIGISAYMTMAGPLAYLRVWLLPEPTGPTPGLAARLGLPFAETAVVIGVAGIVLMLLGREFRRDRETLFWSLAVAVAICTGWAATTWIAENGFGSEAVRSHTFARPTGETLIYLMTMSGAHIDFGIGSVFGVIAGASLGSLIRREFRWEGCEDPRELRRQLLGAFLMGTGAVTALGCGVGQGISAFSVLAPSAPLVLGSIWLGAAIGLRILVEGFHLPGMARN